VSYQLTSSVQIRRQDAVRPQQQAMYTMIIQDNNKASHKPFCAAEKKPNSSRVIISGVAAKVNLHKLCDCPNSEPGKVSADISDHEIGCHIRKRILTGRYTVSTSVIPRKISDGCSLGVAIGGEDY
jgi:hypothetical protein